MNKIVEMTFGSHLYGTNSPTSDLDIKGIYMPTKREIFLSNFPKVVNQSTKKDSTVKNTSDDVDKEFYSLHYFVDLAAKGETVALDMLHAPKSALISTSSNWEFLQSQRSIFYTKNLKSLVGYARKQAAKYGVKGSRLAEARKVLEVLRSATQFSPFTKISDILHNLPKGEHCGMQTIEDVEFYQMCGKKFTLNASAAHYIPMVKNFIDEYGARARQAETNVGVDWKAVSHAFRAAFQVKSILLNGDFTYPLAETDYIRRVKSGVLSFKDEVGPTLDNLMDRVERLSLESKLPDHVDRDKVDDLLLKLVASNFY